MSTLELGVAATVVEERPIGERRRGFDFAYHNRMIPRAVMRDEPALEMRERVVEQRCSTLASRVAHAIEALVLVGTGEPS